MNHLSRLVFPGFYRDRTFKLYNLKNSIAVTVEDIFYHLQKQVMRALDFCKLRGTMTEEDREMESYRICRCFFEKLPTVRSYVEKDLLAAYDGGVVAADYSGSMGNYIMIDHGDDLYTIYMHASKLYVSKGQQVSRGDKIAAVGSTGRSTGPHLHFSVRQSGSYVSPWNYLSK